MNANASLPPLSTADEAKTFWTYVDRATGYVLFTIVVIGGVVTPFALYAYGLINK